MLAGVFGWLYACSAFYRCVPEFTELPGPEEVNDQKNIRYSRVKCMAGITVVFIMRGVVVKGELLVGVQ